jgi:hypothetical protein
VWLLYEPSFLSHFVFLRNVLRLLVTANAVPSSPILVTLKRWFLQEPHGVTSQKTAIFFLPHMKHIYETPRPVTEIALLFYMYLMFVPHRKHTYGIPHPVTGISLFLYVNYVHTSQETSIGLVRLGDSRR